MDTVPDIVALNEHEPRFEILEAAAACFEARGFASTSIDDVARRLGSTKGRIYHHFSSKTDLFTAVYRHGMEMLHVHLQPLAEREMEPLAKLKLLATEHVRMMLATRAFQRVVWEGVELHLRGATTPEQREARIRELASSGTDLAMMLMQHGAALEAVFQSEEHHEAEAEAEADGACEQRCRQIAIRLV